MSMYADTGIGGRHDRGAVPDEREALRSCEGGLHRGRGGDPAEWRNGWNAQNRHPTEGGEDIFALVCRQGMETVPGHVLIIFQNPPKFFRN